MSSKSNVPASEDSLQCLVGRITRLRENLRRAGLSFRDIDDLCNILNCVRAMKTAGDEMDFLLMVGPGKPVNEWPTEDQIITASAQWGAVTENLPNTEISRREAEEDAK